jgi:membrane peptidoglycan carboxypeptidase
VPIGSIKLPTRAGESRPSNGSGRNETRSTESRSMAIGSTQRGGTAATRKQSAPGQGAPDRSRADSTTSDADAAEGALDSPANATAARLIAEGRARMADPSGEPSEGSGRRGRRGKGFDPASLAALPGELREHVVAYWKRRRAKIAAYTRPQRMWHRARLAGLAAFGVLVVLPVMLFFIGYLCFAIPTTDGTVKKQIATIDYADGSQMARIVPAQGNRIKVSINQIPKDVQHAVLSAEDRTFFTNPGFDPMGLARAVVKQLTGGVGGGSTITQQFVKQTLVGDEHSYWRKYKEMIIAVKISQQKSKDDILGDYLNAIYFGRGAYGIEAASKAYFNKDVWELNAAQGALIAGVIQSPSRWDPAINPQHSQERWNYVMDGMVAQGWLSPQARAAAHFPATVPPQKASGGTPSDDRGLILGAVRDELEQRGISEQEFNQEGLTITTTIDPKAQQEAVDAAHQGLKGQPDNLRTALVSIDPTTGAIVAYYGGDNGVGLDYARVSKQPGSTFKPFVLLAALEQDDPIGLGTKFKGEPLPDLRNADGASCQLCDLKQAMTISNNVVFHELAQKVGPQQVADAARQAGITSPLNNPDIGIALGDKEVTPVELASAYATIADGGVYHPPHLVTKVTTSDNRVIYDAIDQDDRRFSQQIARNVTEAMLGVPTYDKLTLSDDRAVAAKTGTVQSYVENQNNDAWTAGFTRQLTSVVWIGTDQNTPIKNAKGAAISGGTLPGQIWKSYMYDATKSQPAESFGPYKPIGTPPEVTGPHDGFMAGNGPSTTASAPGNPSSVQSSVTSSVTSPVQSSPESAATSTASNTPSRTCDQAGCRTAHNETQTCASQQGRNTLPSCPPTQGQPSSTSPLASSNTKPPSPSCIPGTHLSEGTCAPSATPTSTSKQTTG